MSAATGLAIAPELELPLDAVTETFAILAKRGTGKSNAGVVIAEQMYDHGLPWVAVDPKGDWWGIRAAGDGQAPGLPVLVLGGLHGDVPLEPTAGQLVADLVVDQRLTCVLDVSEMTKADQRRFLTAFGDRLYRRNREPLHLFCEEADEYIPQMVRGEDAKLVEVFERLVKKGRFRGIGMTLITQRSASLNKNVLTQIETLIPMRTPSPQDRKAIRDWVDVHAGGGDAVDELPGLDNGEAWVFSPHWLKQLVKIKFHRRRTYDSGATPKVGEKPRPPATLADVDIDALQAAMADTIEKAKADDPKALRDRIRQLERDLAAAVDQPRPEPVVERVEIPVLDEDLLEQWRDQARVLLDFVDSVERRLMAFTAPPAPPPPLERRPRQPRRGHQTGAAAAPGAVVPRAEGPATAAAAPPTDVRLRTGAKRMVESLGRMAPLRLTKSQWGTVAKLKTSGGTWSTYLSDIRRAGLLDETDAGYTLSAAGFAYLGGRPEPMDVAELQDHYRKILRDGAVRMLDALIEAHPDGLTREELSAASAISLAGGTFSTYLSDLVRNGLAERRDGELYATDILIHGADQ